MSSDERKIFANSSSNPRPLLNVVPSTTSNHHKLQSVSRGSLSHLPKEPKNSDIAFLKNLQAYVKELSEENLKLRIRNSELEALFAAAHDEIEENERALLELSAAYEDLLKKSQLKEKVVKNQKKSKSKSKIESPDLNPSK